MASGIDEKGMTVFGFGRNGLSKGINTAPQTFSIGILETTDHNAISKAVQAAMGPTAVNIRQTWLLGGSFSQQIMSSEAVPPTPGFPLAMELVSLSGRRMSPPTTAKRLPQSSIRIRDHGSLVLMMQF